MRRRPHLLYLLCLKLGRAFVVADGIERLQIDNLQPAHAVQKLIYRTQ